MNKIKCHCNTFIYYMDDEQGKKEKQRFKQEHASHVHPPLTRFRVYPSELLQIARNMVTVDEDSHGGDLFSRD